MTTELGLKFVILKNKKVKELKYKLSGDFINFFQTNLIDFIVNEQTPNEFSISFYYIDQIINL